MTIANLPYPSSSDSSSKKRTPKPISWETFERKYLSREDSWKYEWVNGIVEKTKRSMYQEQYFILRNLRNLFMKLHFDEKISGALEPEIDTFLLKNVHRRPDLAWFSEEQSTAMAKGEHQIPNFVIEIISKNDKAREVQGKLKNYRDAGVQVIWQIYPHLEQVNVCLKETITICSGDMICSAVPVLPPFQLAAKEIFSRPE